MAQVSIQVFEGDQFVTAPPNPRPIRVMPSGYLGVVYYGQVYPLYEDNTIDLNDVPIEKVKCPHYKPHKYTENRDIEDDDHDEDGVEFDGNDIFLPTEIKPDDLQRIIRDRLLEYDSKIIRVEQPNTREESRLLRPPVLEILVKEQPTELKAFPYLLSEVQRDMTANEEKGYLSAILEIIADCKQGSTIVS
jgi:hypothetical protein